MLQVMDNHHMTLGKFLKPVPFDKLRVRPTQQRGQPQAELVEAEGVPECKVLHNGISANFSCFRSGVRVQYGDGRGSREGEGGWHKPCAPYRV